MVFVEKPLLVALPGQTCTGKLCTGDVTDLPAVAPKLWECLQKLHGASALAGGMCSAVMTDVA